MTEQEWIAADAEYRKDFNEESKRHKDAMRQLYERKVQLNSLYVANSQSWWNKGELNDTN